MYVSQTLLQQPVTLSFKCLPHRVPHSTLDDIFTEQIFVLLRLVTVASLIQSTSKSATAHSCDWADITSAAADVWNLAGSIATENMYHCLFQVCCRRESSHSLGIVSMWFFICICWSHLINCVWLCIWPLSTVSVRAQSQIDRAEVLHNCSETFSSLNMSVAVPELTFYCCLSLEIIAVKTRHSFNDIAEFKVSEAVTRQ